MEKKSLPKKVKISDEVLFQEIEGECVLLNLKTEKYFGLDEVGTRFWHLLSENDETDKALSNLYNEYDVESETLQNDLAILIDQLSKQGLVMIEEQ